MPMFPNTVPVDINTIVDATPDALSKKQFDKEDHGVNMQQLLQYGLPAAAVGMFDSVGNSLLPDSVFTEDTVREMLDVNDKGFGQFYNENRDGSMIAGELALSFPLISGAMKLARAGSMMDKALGTGKTGNFLRKGFISTGRTRADMVQDMNMARQTFAKDKLLSATDDGTDGIMNLIKANSREAAANMAKESFAADVALATVFRESDLYFPEDLSAMTNAALFIAPDILLTGLAHRFTRTAMLKHLQAEGGKTMSDVLNPHGLNQTDTVFQEGIRGPGVSIMAVNAIDATQDMASLTGSEALRASGNQRLNAMRSLVSEQISFMFKDNPIAHGITHRLDKGVDTPEVQNLLKHTLEDPSLIIPVISAEGLTAKSQSQYFRNLDNREGVIKKEIEGLTSGMSKLKGVEKKGAESKLAEWRELDDELTKLKNPVVLETDGTLTPLRERKWSVVDDIGKLETVKLEDGGERILSLGKKTATELGMQIGVTSKGKLLIAPLTVKTKGTALGGVPTASIYSAKHIDETAKAGEQLAVGAAQNEAITAMSFEQRAHAQALFQKTLNKYDFKTDGAVTVHEGSSWMEMDFAAQLMQKHPDIPVVNRIKDGLAESVTLREVQFETLAMKFEEFQKLELIRRRASGGILKLKDDQLLSQYDTARAVNLPTETAGGMHPILATFEEWMPLQGGEIRELKSFIKNLDEVDEAMVRSTNMGRLGEELAADRKYAGSMLRHDFNPAHAPSLLVQKGAGGQRFGPDEIAMMVFSQKEMQNQMFSKSESVGAPFVAGIIEEITKAPGVLDKARRPDMILEIPTPNKGIAGQQSQKYAGNPVLENLDRLMDFVDKRAVQMTTKLFDTPNKLTGVKPTESFQKLLSTNHAGSLDLFNNANNTLRQGWHLLEAPVAVEGKGFGLALDGSSSFNQARYKELFGRDLLEDMAASATGEVLAPIRASTVRGSGVVPTPLVVDELALEGLSAITSISHAFLDNLNHLRSIQGLKPINKKAWHVPAVNLRQGTTVYLVDGAGRVRDAINAATHGKAWEAANKAASISTKDGTRLVPMSDDGVMQYFDSIGDVWSKSRNFQFAEHQTGQSTGKLGTAAIEVGDAPLKDVISALQANFNLLTRHTKATFFSSELNYTRGMIMADSAQRKTAKLAKDTRRQDYESILLGRPALTQHSPMGKVYYGLESAFDDVLRGMWDKVHTSKRPTDAAAQKQYDRMQESLKDYNPFKSVEDMLDKTLVTHVPPSARAFVSKLNGFTTDMVLRIFDLGMPLINFASLLATTPAVMSAMRRGADETEDMWLSRIGATGAIVDKDLAMPNTGRMMQMGLDTFFSPEGKRIRQLAADRGYLQQEVAERLNLWTRPKEGYLKSALDNTVDFLSIPTDKSEMMSRDIAFGMAFGVGKKALKLDDEAAMVFAHVHANKNIGDFRPGNRPQMFQGAAGMPMGLFTTWAINWLQRVFGDLEAGRKGAVFWQAGMQQFLFGAESMPGVSSFIETFTTSHDGKHNVTDSMDSIYGRNFTDGFMNGILGSMTGIAVQSRADISLPSIMKGESLANAVPSASVMATLYDGVSQFASSLRQNGGYNSREVTEIISRNGVNGTVRALAEQLAGQSTDKHGNTINANVRDWETIAARVFELKSMREMRVAKEIQRDRMQQITQRENMARLAKQFRSAVRGGTVDGELIESSLRDYVANGGSGPHYKRWVKSQILAAQFDSGSRLLLKYLRKSNEAGGAARLADKMYEE